MNCKIQVMFLFLISYRDSSFLLFVIISIIQVLFKSVKLFFRYFYKFWKTIFIIFLKIILSLK